MADHVTFTGGIPGGELPAHHAMADVFAMPCRTRGAGMDVEGLGIVFVEASAAGGAGGRRRLRGSPGSGAAQQVRACWSMMVDEIGNAISELLTDRDRAAAMGAAGREWVKTVWRWDTLAHRLAGLLGGDGAGRN